MTRTVFMACLALAACLASPTGAAAPAPVARAAKAAPARRPPAARATRPRLRPGFVACVDKADAVIPATQACITDEWDYQQARLDRALASAMKTRPAQAGTLRARQAAWQADTDARCTWDARTEGQQQRIDANMCALYALAARADEIEARR